MHSLPLRLTTSRVSLVWFPAVNLLLFGGFTLWLVILAKGAPPAGLGLVMVGTALMAGFAGFKLFESLLRRDVFAIDERGVTLTSKGRDRTLGWDQIVDAKLEPFGYRAGSALVIRQKGELGQTGARLQVPAGINIRGEELAQLIEQGRSRWGDLAEQKI